jgi:cardiolipin synthase
MRVIAGEPGESEIYTALLSAIHNAEANVVVLGADFARSMEALFARDLEASVEITPEQWRTRGLARRAKEWFARQWEYLL